MVYVASCPKIQQSVALIIIESEAETYQHGSEYTIAFKLTHNVTITQAKSTTQVCKSNSYHSQQRNDIVLWAK
jgi:hypothetical protein